MDVYPKFIILDDVLIISKVTYHKHILCEEVDPVAEKHRIKGGGWFTFEHRTNTFTFFGDSTDFGRAKLEDIQKAVDEGKIFTNVYQTHSIANDHNYAYDTGSEIIPLKTINTNNEN